MINYLAVFIGGGLGCILRFAINNVYIKYINDKVFYATLFSNILGGLILGFCFGLFATKQDVNPALKYALTVGLCGGLTTFSSFSLELLSMLENGAFTNAFLYIIASVGLCLIAAWLGYKLFS